jgi:hypothetical protein
MHQEYLRRESQPRRTARDRAVLVCAGGRAINVKWFSFM